MCVVFVGYIPGVYCGPRVLIGECSRPLALEIFCLAWVELIVQIHFILVQATRLRHMQTCFKFYRDKIVPLEVVAVEM